MKALIKYSSGAKQVKVMETEKPEPMSGQVRIKVAYAGVCGTDIHLYLDDGGYPSEPPVILGHEFSGIIDAVGEGVGKELIGRRTASETYYYTCGKCQYCQSGHKNLCLEKKSIGSAVNGAMAEYVIVPEKNLHLLPDNINMAEAAMTEPLACCAQAVLGFAGIKPGDTVLITGPGTIGLMSLQFAVLCGGKVIMAGTEKDEKRLKLALKLGAADIVYSDTESGREKIAANCRPFGPDVIIECSGSGAAIKLGLDVIRKGGTFVQIGLTGKEIAFDMNLITLKELRLYGSYAQNTEWFMRSLKLMAKGEIRVKDLVSEPYRITDWEQAFNDHISGNGYKFILEIDGKLE